MNEQEVVWAQTHAPVFVKGVGNYKDTLDASAEGPDRQLKMYLRGDFLELHTKGKVILIPSSNVKQMLLK